MLLPPRHDEPCGTLRGAGERPAQQLRVLGECPTNGTCLVKWILVRGCSAGYQPIPGWSVAPESAVREVRAVQPVTVHRLLDSIEDLVRRHRALARAGGTLHAELIAAELDQQVAVLRRLGRQCRD